jgi:hypothetical protein
VKLEYWDAQGLYTSGFVPILPLEGQLCGGDTNAFRSALEDRERTERLAREAEERVGQEFRHSPEELEAFIAKWTEGYKAGPGELAGTLENFQPIAFPVKRGLCYRLVLRFKPGTVISQHALRGIELLFLPRSDGVEIHGGPGFHGQGGVGSIGCPQQDDQILFDLSAYSGSAFDKSRVHELGQGAFSAQVYVKSVSEKELAEEEADKQRQFQESQEFKARSHAETCGKCRNRQLECLDGRHRTSFQDCTSEYRMCLQVGSVYGANECP